LNRGGQGMGVGGRTVEGGWRGLCYGRYCRGRTIRKLTHRILTLSDRCDEVTGVE